MNSEEVIALAEQGILTILLVAGPLLAIALGIGLIVSILQATTQIQEQTLAFIPKIVAVLLGIVVLAPWMYQSYGPICHRNFCKLNEICRLIIWKLSLIPYRFFCLYLFASFPLL